VKILLDTNVLLDAVLERQPFALAAIDLLARVERGQVQAAICATSVTTLHYLLAKALGRAKADLVVRRVLTLCEVAPVDATVLLQAAASGAPDFEDAVQLESALKAGAEAIVTRDAAGFGKAPIAVLDAAAFLAREGARSR
jgi:predicted nucleic acid-binding protein